MPAPIIEKAKELGNENSLVFENFALEQPGEVQVEDVHKLPLEEFLHHAALQREDELHPAYGEPMSAIPQLAFAKRLYKKKDVAANTSSDPESSSGVGGHLSAPEIANRQLRVASWIAVFFLITTDILGPTAAPYTVAQLGYVPGALLYLLFGMAAAYTGVLIWHMFLRLDSSRYPVKTYGDLVTRIFGQPVRYAVDTLQCIQLLFNVAVIILGNGQGLSQIAKGRVCFSVLVVIWCFAGMVVGQIRSLARFGFLANLAIWMNLFVCFATMGVVAHSDPNFEAAMNSFGIPKGPIRRFAVLSGSNYEAMHPNALQFSGQLNGAMNIVYAYGGAMIFTELMAELKRPRDFWKGLFLAEVVIFSCYMVYGMVVYYYQGQFAINPGNQGIPNNRYGWQTALNVISLVSALLAAGLYGNVGIKVLYETFLRKVFRGPALNTTKGRIIWICLVVVYWAVAFVIASAIPQFSALTGLVGSVCILQFTYTFPPIMKFGLDMQLDAMSADGHYDPLNKQTNRIDTWRSFSRWARAYKARWVLHTFHLVFFLASLATAGLGIYSSVESLIEAFQGGNTVATSFGCASPV